MPNEIQIATMVELVKQAKRKTQQLGKTQFQKLVYFCQDRGIPLGYKYEIYHYGPYSFQLSDDMSSLDSLGVLNVGTDSGGFGFHIELGQFAGKYELQRRYLLIMDQVISKLGSNTPAQLEVKATIHFVHRVMKSRGAASESTVASKVRNLKPQFADTFIHQCFRELRSDNLLH